MVHSVDAGSLLFEVVGGSSSDFTLAIQGKVHEDGTYTNIDYVETFVAGQATLTNVPLNVRTSVRKFYLVPHPPQLVRLVATHTKGSLTVYGSVGGEADVIAFNSDFFDAISSAIRATQSDNASVVADTLERIQQQLGQINNHNNLAPGERFE